VDSFRVDHVINQVDDVTGEATGRPGRRASVISGDQNVDVESGNITVCSLKINALLVYVFFQSGDKI